MEILGVLAIVAVVAFFWLYTQVVLPSRVASQSILTTEDKPIARLMDEHNLPKPSSLMAGMLALRIARIPAARQYAKTQDLYLRIPIRNGKAEIEVRLSSAKRHSEIVWSVSVGLPGNNDGKGYLSVDLNEQEQKEIIDQMHGLMKRSRDMVAVEREGDSQHAALSILEDLL